MDVKNNITIFQAAAKSGRARLVAVSKNQPNSKIAEAYEAGQRIFGENKVQELVQKYESLPPDIEWHMIGHLQTNKVKYITPFVSLIHSVDSERLLAEIDRQAKKHGRVVSCLLQVHIAREETKFGWAADELFSFLGSPAAQAFSSVRITGLMGMASLTGDTQQIAAEFKGLKNTFEECRGKYSGSNIDMKELSIGMSSDYKIALEHGSTLIRVGTAIFGGR